MSDINRNWTTRNMAVPSNRRGKLLLAAASGAIALVIVSPAAAQDDPAAGQDTNATNNVDDANQAGAIIVTGIRGSLQRNLNAKRAATGVVDMISSEDIGKFPDSNVASAMQRLPGVSIQRAGARGEAKGVTIRGFGGDFNDTLYRRSPYLDRTGGRGVDFTTSARTSSAGQRSQDARRRASTSAIGAHDRHLLPKPFDLFGPEGRRDGGWLASVAQRPCRADRRRS